MTIIKKGFFQVNGEKVRKRIGNKEVKENALWR